MTQVHLSPPRTPSPLSRLAHIAAQIAGLPDRQAKLEFALAAGVSFAIAEALARPTEELTQPDETSGSRWV